MGCSCLLPLLHFVVPSISFFFKENKWLCGKTHINAGYIKLCIENIVQTLLMCSYLVRVQDFQEGFVDVWLTLEAVLDLVDIIYSVIEFHRLVVLERRPTWWCAADRSVRLDRRWAWRGIGWDGWVGLAGGCMGWRLNWLQGLTKKQQNNFNHLSVVCGSLLICTIHFSEPI